MRRSTCESLKLVRRVTVADAELHPLVQHLADVLAPRPAVEAEHDEVDREVFFEARVREHEAHEFVRVLARGARLEHEAHPVLLVGLVVHLLERAEDQLLQIRLRRADLAAFLLGLRIGELFDLGHHALGRTSLAAAR